MNLCNWCGKEDEQVKYVGTHKGVDLYAHQSCLTKRALEADELQAKLALLLSAVTEPKHKMPELDSSKGVNGLSEYIGKVQAWGQEGWCVANYYRNMRKQERGNGKPNDS